MRFLFFTFSACFFISCQNNAVPETLVGTWRASSLVVLDSIWDVEVDPVQLEITRDMHYTLNWYGGAIESGNLTADGKWIHIESTSGVKRKIRILQTGQDTLSIIGPINDQHSEIGFVRLTDPLVE